MIYSYSQHIFQHSCRIAEHSDSISMPRVIQCQQHRSNPEFTSVQDFFKKTVAIPFLDHLISDISLRFTAHSKQLVTCLIDDLQEAITYYNIVDEELCRWKANPQQDRPDTLSNTLKECCPTTLLKWVWIAKIGLVWW